MCSLEKTHLKYKDIEMRVKVEDDGEKKAILKLDKIDINIKNI